MSLMDATRRFALLLMKKKAWVSVGRAGARNALIGRWEMAVAESLQLCVEDGLLLFYIVTTSKFISGWAPTCDNVLVLPHWEIRVPAP